MKIIFFSLILFALSGCTYHWKSTESITPITYEAKNYRSSNSVGNLRRLVLMPIEHEAYEGRYRSVNEQREASRRFEMACSEFLHNKKGYEIIILSDKNGKWQNIGTDNNKSESNMLNRSWNKEYGQIHTKEVIQKIGKDLNSDGILVIRLKEIKPWNTIDGILNIALLNIPLFYNIATPESGAWIYETASGKLIWRNEISIIGDTNTVNSDTLLDLFRDLENAVPIQLIP